MTRSSKLLTSVAQSTSYNILLQLVFRVLTFILNAIVLRYISKDLLGVVNVRLTLLYSTVLFIGREAFRKACLTKTKEDVSWQEIVNIAWCCPVVGSCVAVVMSYIWLTLLELPDPAIVPYYSYGVFCFSCAAVLEMTSEPLFIIGQKLLYVRLKALIEGLALLFKCLVTITLVIAFPNWGIIVFCLAQLTFTFVYVWGYFLYFTHQTRIKSSEFPLKHYSDFLPKAVESGGYINAEMAHLTLSFLKQSSLKQLLTEGERYVMTVFNILSFADQGVFDVISNLGSLVARFFFLPLEENSYLLFSLSITRGIPAVKQPQQDWKLATQVHIYLLKLVSLVGLTILVFGYPYSQLALHLYGGSVLSSGIGPYLLRWYCVYVLALAINGITECFSFATMSKEAVDKYNYKMLGFSAGFLAASLFFTSMFGSAGFIMANTCNMLARILHSVYIIELFYKDTTMAPMRGSLLNPLLYILYSIHFVVLYIAEVVFGMSSPLVFISIGVVCLLTLCTAIYTVERDMVVFIMEKFIRPIKQK